jgi:hypothetical protein
MCGTGRRADAAVEDSAGSIDSPAGVFIDRAEEEEEEEEEDKEEEDDKEEEAAAPPAASPSTWASAGGTHIDMPP